jgi:hypothetical protein
LVDRVLLANMIWSTRTLEAELTTSPFSSRTSATAQSHASIVAAMADAVVEERVAVVEGIVVGRLRLCIKDGRSAELHRMVFLENVCDGRQK